MEGPTAALSQSFHTATTQHAMPPVRRFQPPSSHHLQNQLTPPAIDPNLQGLDPSLSQTFHPHFHNEFDSPSTQEALHAVNAFDQRLPHQHSQSQPRFHEIQANGLHASRSQQNGGFQQQGGQFGVLTPHPAAPGQSTLQHRPQNDATGRLHQEDLFGLADQNENRSKSEGHFSGMKMIPDPPNLGTWREKLFNVNDTITLAEDEFQTYFPHIDNVYSHRSTQQYKRKPFISHYWDCRLKGRPPGTPKSEDPTKKKRKRQARERDLCDVKIKITEYFSSAMMDQEFGQGGLAEPGAFFTPAGQPNNEMSQPTSHFGVIGLPFGSLPPNHPGLNGQRYYTVQRVNGNGGNGKGDGVAGPHKHTLEESDRVKKNSIQRHFLKEEKEKKRTQKSYHKKATGPALATVKKRTKDHELKLYGSCFCPFVQRVWISLEAKGINYQYVEIDPYKKPDELLEINPRGLVPALRHGDWGCYESTVLMEYLEDLSTANSLLPLGDPKRRAFSRLWSDHVNRKIVPKFYSYLQAQEQADQISHAQELATEISKLTEAADIEGPFFLGPSMSFVDVQIAPWMIRLTRVLKPYRGWPDPEEGSRWGRWVEAVEKNEHVRATTSTDELYLDSYERYAENRPDTSELAKAINAGKGLP